MNAIDTNVLVRLITRDEVKQTAVAEEFVDAGAWVSHLVLAETTWVLSAVYELKASGIGTAIEMLLNHQRLAVQDRTTVMAALEHFKRRPALGFSDCLVLEIARRAGHLPLGTFDRKLSNLDGAQKL
jgi:predicted nucleic-acid-binding protein